MAQSKMKFGIDLGTTNSAICKMESGEPVIKKTDTLKDTLPSCVSFTKKKIANKFNPSKLHNIISCISTYYKFADFY